MREAGVLLLMIVFGIAASFIYWFLALVIEGVIRLLAVGKFDEMEIHISVDEPLTVFQTIALPVIRVGGAMVESFVWTLLVGFMVWKAIEVAHAYNWSKYLFFLFGLGLALFRGEDYKNEKRHGTTMPVAVIVYLIQSAVMLARLAIIH